MVSSPKPSVTVHMVTFDETISSLTVIKEVFEIKKKTKYTLQRPLKFKNR